MTLLAFAAERRAAAPLLVSAGSYYRWISHACGTLGSKPAARRCCCRSMGQTDGQTDRRTKSAVLSIGFLLRGPVNLHCQICFVVWGAKGRRLKSEWPIAGVGFLGPPATGFGEGCELPSRVWGRTPAAVWFSCALMSLDSLFCCVIKRKQLQ